MIHPDTELRFVSDTIGYGVFATRPIPRGTITWVRDLLDQVIEPEKYHRLPALYKRKLERYAYVDRRGRWVLCWDLARSVNHSCSANCLSPGYEFEIAVRDIAAGEELTDEYGSLNLHESFECDCGAPDCRRTVHPDDVVRLHGQWDDAIRAAFPEIPGVPQPLWEIVTKKDKERVDEVLADRGQLESVLKNYYDLAAKRGNGKNGKRRVGATR